MEAKNTRSSVTEDTDASYTVPHEQIAWAGGDVSELVETRMRQ